MGLFVGILYGAPKVFKNPDVCGPSTNGDRSSCLYLYIYICMFTSMFIPISISASIYVYRYIYVYMYSFSLSLSLSLCIYAYICIYICIYIYMYIYIYVRASFAARTPLCLDSRLAVDIAGSKVSNSSLILSSCIFVIFN